MLPGVPDLLKPELGCLKDFELEVRFKPEARPIICKPRPVPWAILKDLNDAYEDGIRKQCGRPLTSMPMEPPWFRCERQSFQDKTRLALGSAGITQ